MTVQTKIEPIFKSLTVDRSLNETFAFYTEQMDSWWPKATHSIGQKGVETVTMECRQGGRIYETHKDGTEALWGTILEWDAPNQFVHSWHVGRGPDQSTEVEVTFKDVGNGQTLVELTHRNWERLGEDAVEARKGYDGGWDHVFGACFGGGLKS